MMQNLHNYKRIVFVLGKNFLPRPASIPDASDELILACTRPTWSRENLPLQASCQRDARSTASSDERSAWPGGGKTTLTMGQRHNSKLSTGRAVSSDATASILRDLLDRPPFDNSKILLDDFPRNLDQACRFEDEVRLEPNRGWLPG